MTHRLRSAGFARKPLPPRGWCASRAGSARQQISAALVAAAVLFVATPLGAAPVARAGAGPAAVGDIEFPDVPDILGEPDPPAEPAPPTAEALLAELKGVVTVSSLSVVARMAVRRGGAVHGLDFSLWVRQDGKALLRVREPQRLAGRAILRDGAAVWLHDPDSGRVTRVGPQGDRAPWGELLLRILDIVVGEALPGGYAPVAVRPARAPGAAWTLVLRGREGADVRCRRLEVDVAAVSHALVGARCRRGEDGLERWRFDQHRDFGGRLLPTEVSVDLAGSEGWSATLQILRLGVDVPVGDALFTRAALSGQR